MLPEDRADALYFRYDGGGVVINGPSVLVRKSIGEHVSVSANHYIDMVSSASIDVETSASPYEDERTQSSLSVDFLHGKSMYTLGYVNSDESDYKAKTMFGSVSHDMFGDLTTIGFGYKNGENEVFRNVKDATAWWPTTRPSPRDGVAELQRLPVADHHQEPDPLRPVRSHHR